MCDCEDEEFCEYADLPGHRVIIIRVKPNEFLVRGLVVSTYEQQLSKNPSKPKLAISAADIGLHQLFCDIDTAKVAALKWAKAQAQNDKLELEWVECPKEWF